MRSQSSISTISNQPCQKPGTKSQMGIRNCHAHKLQKLLENPRETITLKSKNKLMKLLLLGITTSIKNRSTVHSDLKNLPVIPKKRQSNFFINGKKLPKRSKITKILKNPNIKTYQWVQRDIAISMRLSTKTPTRITHSQARIVTILTMESGTSMLNSVAKKDMQISAKNIENLTRLSTSSIQKISQVLTNTTRSQSRTTTKK